MPKFAAFKNRELKTILSAHKLSTSGSKAKMVKRLNDALNRDELSNEELISILLKPESKSGVVPNDVENTEGNGNASENGDENREQREAGSINGAGRETSSIIGADNDEEDAYGVIDDQYSISSRVSNRQPMYKFSVKEISETIPKYDPTNVQSMSAEHFVNHVDRAIGFDTKCLLLAVYSRLKGVARLWLDGQRELFTSWGEFKYELLAEFGQDLDEAEINNIMSKAVRRPDEKLNDYCFRMQALGRRYGLSERATIKHTRNGLRNRELQNAIAVMKFETMRHMRKSLEDYENNIVDIPRYASENRPNKRTTNTTNAPFVPVHVSTDPKMEITCYNCNERGHISRHCTKPQRKERCTICLRTNHKTESCYQRQRDGAVKQERVNAINNAADTYPNVVKDIILDGRVLKAFMDSGSSLSLIREQCMKHFKNIADCKKILNGFAGGQYTAEKRILADLNLGDKIHTVELYVLRDEDIPENVLLGRDVLCREGNEFVVGSNSCQIRTIAPESKDEHSVKTKREIAELKLRIARWWLRMQEYNFDVVHRPGSRLAHVDAMSHQ